MHVILPHPVPNRVAIYVACEPPGVREVQNRLGRIGPWFDSAFYCLPTKVRIEGGRCLLTFTPMDLMWGHFLNADGSIGDKIPAYGREPVDWSEWLPADWKELQEKEAERYFDADPS